MRVQEPWGLAEPLLKCWRAVPALSAAAAAWEVDLSPRIPKWKVVCVLTHFSWNLQCLYARLCQQHHY